MSRAIQFFLFIVIALGLTALLHHYAWVRLVRDPGFGGPARSVATGMLWGMFALMAVSIPGYRLLPRSMGSPLMWVVYTWMGALLFLTLSLGVADLLRWVALHLAAPPEDPGRRLFLQRALSGLALGATGALSTVALRSALQRVAVRDLDVTLPRLPPSMNGLRLVQLTDLHIGPTIDGAWLREVVAQVNALAPDLIAITGDLVDGTVERLASQLAPLAELRARHGVFFVTGNHEYYSGVDAWLAELRRLGVRVLRNERVAIPGPDGARLEIAGVDDHHSTGWPGHGPDLRRALRGRDPAHPVILLAHQPAAIFEAAALGVDLQLSGHTHGGQIWPWHYMVRLQQPYVAGIHRHPGSDTQRSMSAAGPATGGRPCGWVRRPKSRTSGSWPPGQGTTRRLPEFPLRKTCPRRGSVLPCNSGCVQLGHADPGGVPRANGGGRRARPHPCRPRGSCSPPPNPQARSRRRRPGLRPHPWTPRQPGRHTGRSSRSRR